MILRKLITFLLLCQVNCYAQDKSITVTEKSNFEPHTRIYEFDDKGKLLNIKTQAKNGKVGQKLNIEYKDGLLNRISNIPSDPDLTRVYHFIYDKDRRLIAQASTSQEDTIKFHYDNIGRLAEITNYNDGNVTKIYDNNGSIIEERSKWSNLAGYSSNTEYIKETNKVIEKETFTTPIKQIITVTTKEYDGSKLIRESIQMTTQCPLLLNISIPNQEY